VDVAGGQRQNGSTGDGDLRTAVKGLRLNRPHQPLLEEIVESAPRAERTLDRRSSQGARAEDDDRPVEERKSKWLWRGLRCKSRRDGAWRLRLRLRCKSGPDCKREAGGSECAHRPHRGLRMAGAVLLLRQ